ncbi:MAG: IS200/IS605 family transposase [Gammaproteobacteria bacterium]|nr:IS200/IS605 family transposase [Gammaproteobacteria bacterium]
MNDSTKIRTGRHVVYNMHVHLVFVTKYRNIVFTKPMLEYLKSVFSSICNDFEVTLTEFDGENDHVHLLIHYPPKIQLSKLVNSLKGVSSRMLRIEFEKQISKLYWKGVLWSPSYFAASCGGAPIETVKKYIQKQKSPTQ